MSQESGRRRARLEREERFMMGLCAIVAAALVVASIYRTVAWAMALE